MQDDLRLRPNLTFSPGLRYEMQTHVHDLSGFGPRLGLTWAPGKNGRTSIRTSYGIFYNWLGANVYEQTLRVDGVRQREINIQNPTFPNPGGDATVSASNKYILGDIRMERIQRFSAAIDRVITPKMRTSLTFSTGRYRNQLRGVNLNAPVRGVRPDPAFANVIEVTSDASMETYDVVPDFSVNFAGGIRNADQAKWNPKRTTIRFNYRHRRSYNNTDGAFSVSPSGTLDDQWAPAGGDTRHRLRASAVDAGVSQSQRANELGRQQRIALHDHDRHRRERRFDLQRSPVPGAAQQRAPAVAIDDLRERVVPDSDRQGAGRRRVAGRARADAGPAGAAADARRASRSASRRRT